MSLEMWSNESGHWFIDTDLEVQIGQAHQLPDGTWELEVNDNSLTAPDLDTVMRLVVENYDPSLVEMGPLSEDGDIDRNAFQIVDLSHLQKSLGR
jgi:hypothetical protein